MRKGSKIALICAAFVVTLCGGARMALADPPKVWIQSDVARPKIGDVVVLTAQTSGVDDETLKYQWIEAQADGSDARDLVGETDKQYRFVFEARHSRCVWQVRLIEAGMPEQHEAAMPPAPQPVPSLEPITEPSAEPSMVPPVEPTMEQPTEPSDNTPMETPSEAPVFVETPTHDEAMHPVAVMDEPQDAPETPNEQPSVEPVDIQDSETPLTNGNNDALMPIIPDVLAPQHGELVTLSPDMPVDETQIAHYQWYQDSGDGNGYQPIPGQTQPTYSYTYDGTQRDFHWKVLVTFP